MTIWCALLLEAPEGWSRDCLHGSFSRLRLFQLIICWLFQGSLQNIVTVETYAGLVAINLASHHLVEYECD